MATYMKNNYPLVLNKVTLRYQDGAKQYRDEPTSSLVDDNDNYNDDEFLDDEKSYYQTQANENFNIHFSNNNEPFYLNDDFKRSNSMFSYNNNNKLNYKKRLSAEENFFSFEKSLNRLSLLKFRENNNQSSQNEENLKNNKKNKVNKIVSEIVPLISNKDPIIVNHNNEYNDYESTLVQQQQQPLQQSLSLPKMSRTLSLKVKSPRTQVPNETLISPQLLPRPFTNNITNKNKVFNLVYGINNKFIQKYLPKDKKSSLYLNEKLPGHLALYKLMKENTYIKGGVSTNQTSNELERIRKEILSRTSSYQQNLGNEIPELQNISTPRIEDMSPSNFPLNKITIKRNYSLNEPPTFKRSISNFGTSHSLAPTPTLTNGTQKQLKNADSVMAYLTHIKQDN